jgi:hypothetical protein
MARNEEEKVARTTGQVPCVHQDDDTYRLVSLTALEGISPVLASIILSFYEPERYCIFDQKVWKPLLGNAL